MQLGPGSRLGSKTKNFNKAFLRIGNQAAISHIISYFPKDYKFVIVTGYLGDELEQYVSIAHPEINKVFVRTEKHSGDLAGPGYALSEAKSHIGGEFYIWTADTLVSEFGDVATNEDCNWIGYAESENTDGNFSCMSINNNVVSDFFEKKSKEYTKNIYIGCAFVKDYESFWKAMEEFPIMAENQYQVSAGFFGMLKDNKKIKAKQFNWYDIGTSDSLYKTKKEFKCIIENLDKEDEEIYFLDSRVIKYFKDSKIASNRFKRADSLRHVVPKLLANSNNFYSYEFTNGKDLFSIDRPQDHMLGILELAKENLWKEKNLDAQQIKLFHDACYDFYFTKTKTRINQLYTKINMYDTETEINGQYVPKLYDMLFKLKLVKWEKILAGTPTLMHGDFNFSNILLTSNNEYKFIDWRQDFGGILDFGDMYYDLAKMYSGLVFPHDMVKSKKYCFSIKMDKIEVSVDSHEKYEKCKEIFFKFLKDNSISESKVKQMAGITLINMSPLHEMPLNVVLYYLGKEELWKSIKEVTG